MIDPVVAISLVLCGSGVTLLGVLCGLLAHMRYLDRKLLPPAKPAHKPTGGTTTA